MTITIDIPADLGITLNLRRHTPSDAELALAEKLESGRAALPVLPAVAASAIELANDTNADLQAFSRLIETDPPIAARFLGVANSALYSRGRKISSVFDAVMRIGLYSARDLLFQAAYGQSLKGLRYYQNEVEESFRRSVVSAVTCRVIGGVIGSSFRESYLCGLLHDIGESRIYRILSEAERPLPRAEAADLVTRYHTRAGAELAVKWKLPQEIIDVCSHHHDPEVQGSEALDIVRIADWAVPLVCSELDGDAVEVLEHLDGLEGLQVDESQARAIVQGGVAAAQRL